MINQLFLETHRNDYVSTVFETTEDFFETISDYRKSFETSENCFRFKNPF